MAGKFTCIDERAPSDFEGVGGGGGVAVVYLARQIYTMPEYASVEIGMQTHSKCKQKQKRSQDSCYESYIQL